MSNTYTSDVKLAMPAIGDTGWSTPVNGNAVLLDALNPVGDLCVTAHESPSASLNVDVASGIYLNQANVATAYAGATSVAVTASATTVLWLTNSGVLTSGSTFPVAPNLYIPLASVVAGTATITGITDKRTVFPVIGAGYLPLSGGTLADPANLVLGTTTGTQIGTATTQKLGFFGKTPIVQPTIGAGTATGTYGSNEQTMLQAVYNAVRNLGLGS